MEGEKEEEENGECKAGSGMDSGRAAHLNLAGVM